MKHPENVYLKDTSGSRAWKLTADQKMEYEKSYHEVMSKSLFILAPRGILPCSYRLFEAMQMGRVPVIIADDWVKIPGIPWEEFSITIPESKIEFVSEILEERKHEAVKMGETARQYWESHCSPEVSLYRISIAAKELLNHRYSLLNSLADYSQFIRSPFHLKNFLRVKRNQWKKKLSKKKNQQGK